GGGGRGPDQGGVGGGVGLGGAGRPGGGGHGGGHEAGQEVELPLPVLVGVADVQPVVAGDPSVERDAVGEEPGKELALDGDRAVGGDAREELPLEDVEA